MVRLHTTMVSIAAGVCVMAACCQPDQARAEDFRIDNAVYVGDQKEPFTQSTTIFQGGVVYDCLKSPAETVVFDAKVGRFVLLSMTHKKRTELKTTEITLFLTELRMKAAGSKNPLMKFLAEPKFEEQYEQSDNTLTLGSPWMNYRLVLTTGASPEMVQQYREFCDWSARLNTLLVPGSLPPFARLKVNAAMAGRQALASQITRTITPEKTSQKQQPTVRSEHRLVRPLEPADLTRVAQAREFMESFKLVGFDQYRKIESR